MKTIQRKARYNKTNRTIQYKPRHMKTIQNKIKRTGSTYMSANQDKANQDKMNNNKSTLLGKSQHIERIKTKRNKWNQIRR